MTSPLDAKAIKTKIANGDVKTKKTNGKKAPLVRKPDEDDEFVEPKEAPDKPEKKKDVPKATEKKKTKKEVKFPLQAFINGYGFLRFSKSLLDSWGWKPGKGNRTLVTLDMQDGVLIVKKKAA